MHTRFAIRVCEEGVIPEMFFDEFYGNAEPSVFVWCTIIDQVFSVALLNCDELFDEMKRAVDDVNMDMTNRVAQDENK